MSIVQQVIHDKYNRMLLQDFLRSKIRDAGLDAAEIERKADGTTHVTLHVTKPGLVIGRKGSSIRELTDSLESDHKMSKPQVSVQEIDKPDLSPSVMCSRMASHLERGTAFRRAMMWTLQQVMEAGARGVQITVSGKLRGDRSAFEKHTAGILPRAGDHADRIVREDVIDVKTPMGLIGIRIRIALADRYKPEFDMKDAREVARRERERERRRRDRELREREQREARERHREQSSRVRGAGVGAPGAAQGGSGRGGRRRAASSGGSGRGGGGGRGRDAGGRQPGSGGSGAGEGRGRDAGGRQGASGATAGSGAGEGGSAAGGADRGAAADTKEGDAR